MEKTASVLMRMTSLKPDFESGRANLATIRSNSAEKQCQQSGGKEEEAAQRLMKIGRSVTYNSVEETLPDTWNCRHPQPRGRREGLHGSLRPTGKKQSAIRLSDGISAMAKDKLQWHPASGFTSQSTRTNTPIAIKVLFRVLPGEATGTSRTHKR